MANRQHPTRLFLTLSLFFLIPSSDAYPLFQALLSGNASPAITYIISIPLILFLGLVFSSIVTIPITFTAYCFNNNSEPTDHNTPLKSTPTSFFPYMATNFLYQSIKHIAIFVFGFITSFSITAIGLYLGFSTLNPASPSYFMAFLSSLAIVPTMYFKINWFLDCTESKWGFEALTTSKGLIKGKRWTLASLILFLWIVSLIISLSNRVVGARTSTFWMFLIDITVILFNIGFGILIQLYTIIVTTMLYGVICKTSSSHHDHGENSSLPVNDEKVALH